MTQNHDFNAQFKVGKKFYIQQFDFLSWYRYYFILKEVIDFNPNSILEIGAGSGMVKNCLQPIVNNYVVMDINVNLEPDIVTDVREQQKDLNEKFDCVIVADVLEHMPFEDLQKSLHNLNGYLRAEGRLFVTIPHRRSHFLIMTPAYKPRVITVPTGLLSPSAFYRRFIKRKIWIDPDHCWEIGDGKIKKSNVENAFLKTDFNIEKFKKLLYVDFWVLKKSRT